MSLRMVEVASEVRQLPPESIFEDVTLVPGNLLRSCFQVSQNKDRIFCLNLGLTRTPVPGKVAEFIPTIFVWRLGTTFPDFKQTNFRPTNSLEELSPVLGYLTTIFDQIVDTGNKFGLDLNASITSITPSGIYRIPDGRNFSDVHLVNSSPSIGRV